MKTCQDLHEFVNSFRFVKLRKDLYGSSILSLHDGSSNSQVEVLAGPFKGICGIGRNLVGGC